MPKLTKPFHEWELLKDEQLDPGHYKVMSALVEETIKYLSPIMEWQAFADGDPDCGDGIQVHILFGSKDWGGPMLGVWNKLGTEEDKHLGIYNCAEDKIYEWEGKFPTHYMIIKEIK